MVNIPLKDLYQFLLIFDNNYPYFANFKQRVLVPVINEFKKIEDIKIQKWELIKKGREVSGVGFWVYNDASKLFNKKNVENQHLHQKAKCQKWFKGIYKIRENKNLIGFDQRLFYGCSKFPDCKSVISIKEYDKLVKF